MTTTPEQRIEPCGFCGKQPRAKQHYVFPERIDHSCDCFVLQNYWCGLHNWNAAQSRIRALRIGDISEAWNERGLMSGGVRYDDQLADYLAAKRLTP